MSLLWVFDFCAIFFLTIVSAVRCTPVYFQDCGNGEIKSIDIQPCHSLPCHFDEGSRANLTIVFQLDQPATNLRLYSTLRTGGFIPYEIEVKDDDPYLCRTGDPVRDWGKIQCPIKPNKEYTFVASRKFPVSTTWNLFRYSKIKILDEYDYPVACADWYLQFDRSLGPDELKPFILNY